MEEGTYPRPGILGQGRRTRQYQEGCLHLYHVYQIQKSWEVVKWLDRLAPNLAHMCRFIWEWIYAKQIAPRDTRGALGGFRGSDIQKSGEAVKRLDRLAPTLVHICGFIWEWTSAKYKSPLDTTGGISGITNCRAGKLSNGWTDWHQI